MNKVELGSRTAKGGFANEKAICRKFNAWRDDNEAREWLKIMGYNILKIDSVKAIQIPTIIKKGLKCIKILGVIWDGGKNH